MADPLPPVFVRHFHEILPVVNEMKGVAKQCYIQERPKYSATPEEALANALPHAEDILSNGLCRTLVLLPDRVVTAMTLSIDDFEGEETVWHLSLSRPDFHTMRPERPSDSVVRIITKAFFGGEKVTEGPAEGAYETVRHFRCRYLPE